MLQLVQPLLRLSRTSKRVIQVATDLTILTAIFAFAMWLRLDSWAFVSNPRVWIALLPVLPITILVFVGMGFYRVVVRHITGRALLTIVLGCFVSGTALSLVSAALGLPVPRSVPIIYTLMAILAIGGIRYAFREIIALADNGKKERVAIYGAGEAGRQLVQMLRQSNQFLPVAFLDDQDSAQGTHVAGLRVYDPTQLAGLIESRSITSVLLAIPSAGKARRSEILMGMEQFPLHLRTVPGLTDILIGKARLDEIYDIAIEDLLGRDPVVPEPGLLGATIADKVVMVTGAGGSIGAELCRQILHQRPRHLILYELSELALYSIEQELQLIRQTEGLTCPISPILGSVQSRESVERALRLFKVQTVYHTAAYKHVPLVEYNVAEGVRNNVHGTRVVAEASVACKVESFILISTDKAVRPTNFMGASKRLAEMVCQELASRKDHTTKLSMVRFGNVLGSSGSIIPLFQRQIAAGGPLTVTHPDITRFFMTIPEAALLVIQAGAMAKGGEVFVLEMGDPVHIVDLATRMVRLHGLKPVLLEADSTAKLGRGEIGIMFTKLRPGEKLFEELLIGNDPQPTNHPRILMANERFLPRDGIAGLLDALMQACTRNEIARIQQLLIQGQTDYQPNSTIVDPGWTQTPQPEIALDDADAGDPKRLTLVWR